MIVERGSGWVAMWFFSAPGSISPTSRSRLRPLLELCQSAAGVLEKHELFRPTALVFSGWLRGAPADGTLARVDAPEVHVPLVESARAAILMDRCEAVLDQLEEKRGFLYPAFVDFLGKGVVYDADGGRHELPDVCWIRGATLNHHVVYVHTQSDAWLPYTLEATPQPDVWKRNAPRLEAALRELEQRLSVELTPDEQTRYATINGFRLDNLKDMDGEVLEVL